MSRRTVDALDELVTLVEKHETLGEIRRLITSLFRSPGQLFIALSLFTIYFYSSAIAGGRLSVSILFVLIGSYALVGSIALTAAGGLPLFRTFIVSGQYTVWQSIWLLLFLPVILLSWIYPYAKLKGLVKRIKRRRMHLLKTIISRTFDDWIRLERSMKEIYSTVGKSEPDRESLIKALDERAELYNKIRPEFEQMKGYHTVFNEIDKSPESFFDVRAALELAQVMGIPTLFAVLSYLAKQIQF